jgi:formylglycine-generating enzyme required for sulfatase activity/nitrate/TMAO reductase-like tetraheme cytochrome c subunit
LARILTFLKSHLLIGFAIGCFAVVLASLGNHYTSSDRFCESCHVHPQATSSWKLSTHYATESGMITHCVECHLPPGGVAYAFEKTRLGVRDVFGKLFKDDASFDWDRKSLLEHAGTFTFRDACLSCHQNLFPIGLSQKGDEAHLHYTRKEDELRCLNCHLHVGHFDPNAAKTGEFGLTSSAAGEIYTAPAAVERFVDYTEYIPGTSVAFEMVSIPGGTFTMGSPASESYRRADEGPTRDVAISSFWMGRVEVSWAEFEAWYQATAGEGRTDTRLLEQAEELGVDAVTGATPPYGAPDQGWGKGDRPAITMTWHAATKYCEWLTKVTGRTYRLPTEAEWEYACRAGTTGPYFFEGDPKDFNRKRLWNRLFGTNREGIDPYVIHTDNSSGKTQPPSEVSANPYGLLNMLGNVREFCLDWYAPDAYGHYPEGQLIEDPMGPATGSEHVIRGGSFRNTVVGVRSAARDHTRHESWLTTDPQIPKSIWWYSDCVDVGFRVVCEYDGSGG